MSQFVVTVVIPVKNGGSTLEDCLKSFHAQTIATRIQIIVLDSMSGDNSREIATRYNAEIIEVPDGTFNHGLTRNIGVQRAKADLIYFTVQDARVVDVNMLEKMARHFSNENIMAVCGHQAVPHEKDKNPVLWRKTFTEPKVIIKELSSSQLYEELTVEEKRNLVAWDNVVAMYRKAALLEQPFQKVSFAEDWIWCHEAILKGWTLVYDPSLVVYHYHHSTFLYTFRVNYIMNYHFYKYLQFLPVVPSIFRPMAERLYHIFKNNKLSGREKLYWVGHNAVLVVAHKFSVMNFLTRLKVGGRQSVEKGYNKYCLLIPQGKQKAIKKAGVLYR